MGASEEPLGGGVVLLVEFTLGFKAKGNVVDKSRSKADSCSSRCFSMPLRSAPDRPVLSNRRQRQISFRSHLISLNLSSIEVIADVVHFAIRALRTRIVMSTGAAAFMSNNSV
ncbi:hypothetical protein ACVW1C_005628 [Bradyrhizobium sp. USDA 4011]